MNYHKREFLNKNEGMAAFEATVKFQAEGEFNNSVSGEFVISDCNRQVRLDFDIYDEADYNNVIHKARKLAAEFVEFAIKLEAAKAEMDAHRAEREAKKLLKEESENV